MEYDELHRTVDGSKLSKYSDLVALSAGTSLPKTVLLPIASAAAKGLQYLELDGLNLTNEELSSLLSECRRLEVLNLSDLYKVTELEFIEPMESLLVLNARSVARPLLSPLLTFILLQGDQRVPGQPRCAEASVSAMGLVRQLLRGQTPRSGKAEAALFDALSHSRVFAFHRGPLQASVHADPPLAAVFRMVRVRYCCCSRCRVGHGI